MYLQGTRDLITASAEFELNLTALYTTYSLMFSGRIWLVNDKRLLTLI